MRFVSVVPTRTSPNVKALAQDERTEGKQETAVLTVISRYNQPEQPTQTPEPSVFSERFKQRSQLCSNRNFPIRLPVFYKKSYTIAGLTARRSRLGHLITKAEFARRHI